MNHDLLFKLHDRAVEEIKNDTKKMRELPFQYSTHDIVHGEVWSAIAVILGILIEDAVVQKEKEPE